MQVAVGSGESNDSSLPLLPSSTNVIHNDFSPHRLPMALRLLYCLNGVTLSLPMTALLYIVNTRASTPVEYLSAYGAIAFLPCSLKPLYAYISGGGGTNRNVLLVVLLIFSGICAATTALIPQGNVFLCFLLGFVRGIASAWPEFLVGLALVEHARLVPGKFESVAAQLQSEAATARNLGSTVAALGVFLLFVIVKTLNDTIVTVLLVATGILNVVAAVIAFVFQVGSETTTTTTGLTRRLDLEEDDVPSVRTSVQSNSSFGRGNCVLLVIFQLSMIVVSMQGPIAKITCNAFWVLLVVFLVALLLLLLRKWPISWRTSHSVGLFLIVRHAIPTCDYLMESFFYSKLESKPMLFQARSIINMGVTTLSSWSYGMVFAKINKSLAFCIFLTTTVSSCAVLGNLVLVADSHANYVTFFVLVVTIGSITTFTGEWQFLPDVVLATAASMGAQNNDDDGDKPLTMLMVEDSSQDSAECADEPPNCIMDSSGMLYGTLISCIDFGDQIGAWVTVPLVTVLGISRENDWANLDIFIILTAALGLSSILLLKILKQER